jgi:N-acetylglucosaminyldiphosphoundecaprenol N-acetyl-beta-D-mannosaminyltransferase
MQPPSSVSADDARSTASPTSGPELPLALGVLGVRIDAVRAEEALARMAGWVDEARQAASRGMPVRTRQVVTLNPEMLMAAQADPGLRDLINSADLVLPDGIGVVWAARLHGRRLAGRITGTDTLVALAELAAARGWRVFFLGAAPGVAAAAAGRLSARFPRLAVAGTHAGRPAPGEDEQSSGLVRAGKADVVCVAYGAPAQERWIARNRDHLGAGVALGVGGALDFLAGRVPRAPRWMRERGLEWAYRVWREPWRWRRMLALPRFVLAVLAERWRGASCRGRSTAAEAGAAQRGSSRLRERLGR